MKTEFSEAQMVIEFCKILEKKKKNFAVEVPFFSRSIDLVIDEKNWVFEIIEFKLKDWKKAIKQLRECVISWQPLYVCLPIEKYNENIINELNKLNIWLYLFDFTNKEIYKKTDSKNEYNCNLWLIKLKEWIKYSQNDRIYDKLLSVKL